jgi:hypothetical protein
MLVVALRAPKLHHIDTHILAHGLQMVMACSCEGMCIICTINLTDYLFATNKCFVLVCNQS